MAGGRCCVAAALFALGGGEVHSLANLQGPAPPFRRLALVAVDHFLQTRASLSQSVGISGAR
ncbi:MULTISPECIES: hypothetical protein [Mycobacterium simiae complex]|uniref:Uncharacterized protein n=1 Tax=Mycobacterium lentiflavum TaxID=141349 RepID=A0ABY3V7V7_MYCLN|nr:MULTISPECIES: hypothetical protein [Mycobacterium simiae complex]ULP45583.1 hypothetical protein MJO58_28175 [Mycobacterium lentiflavum]